jgi:hydroxyacylglutathione hydrolase
LTEGPLSYDAARKDRRLITIRHLGALFLVSLVTAAIPEAGPKARDRSRLLEGIGAPLEVYQIPESVGSEFTDAHSYLVCDRSSGEALLVDAGSRSAPLALIRASQAGLRISLLVSTHFHADHTGGNGLVLARTSARMVAPAREAGLLTGEPLAVPDKKQLLTPTTPRIDLKAKQGDELKLGAHTAKVIEIPGHSPGSICLYFPAEKFLISGDVLLKGGVGRTGIPHAQKTPEGLVAAIRSKLLPLPDATAVLPGHGPLTTIGEERASNPWLQPPPKPQKKAGGKADPEPKKR